MNDFIERKLSNGIRVYYYSDKSLKRVYASINIEYGTNGYYDEFFYGDKEYHTKPAMAHFLEHYLIETSKNGNMLLKYFDKNYEANGITYPDLTTYYFVGIDSKKKIYDSIRELLTMVEEPVFNNENVEQIKKAICQELTSGEDNRYQIALSSVRHNLHSSYDAVPVDNNVLGSIESTESISLDDVKLCYNAYYNDENKFIVIAGNIDIDEVHKLLNSYYKKRPLHKNLLKEYCYGLDTGVRNKLEIINMPTDADIVESSFKIKIDKNLSLLEQSFYIEIYMTSKLANSRKEIEKLMESKHIISGISFFSDYFKGMCDVTVSYESNKPKSSIKKIEDILNEKKFSKKEFELLKKDAIVKEIRAKDHMYYIFKLFPTRLAFSKHFDDIKEYNNFTFKKYKKYISKIDFKFETTTIITKKRIRK